MGNQLLTIEPDRMFVSDTAKRRGGACSNNEKTFPNSNKLKTGLGALFWLRGKVRSVPEASPASSSMSVKTLVQTDSVLHNSNNNNHTHVHSSSLGGEQYFDNFTLDAEEEKRSHRASTYDSLNLEDLSLDVAEEAFNGNDWTMNKVSTIGPVFASNPPSERFLFRPILSELNHSVNGPTGGFGIDPEFVVVSSQFGAKRNRNLELSIQ